MLWECTDTSARALCQETFCGRQERNLAQWQGLFCTLKGVTTSVTQWVEMEATVDSHAWLRKKNLWQQWFPYKKNTNKKNKHLWDGDLDFKQCKYCFCVCFHEVCTTDLNHEVVNDFSVNTIPWFMSSSVVLGTVYSQEISLSFSCTNTEICTSLCILFIPHLMHLKCGTLILNL